MSLVAVWTGLYIRLFRAQGVAPKFFYFFHTAQSTRTNDFAVESFVFSSAPFPFFAVFCFASRQITNNILLCRPTFRQIYDSIFMLQMESFHLRTMCTNFSPCDLFWGPPKTAFSVIGYLLPQKIKRARALSNRCYNSCFLYEAQSFMKFLYYLGRTSIAFVKLKEKPCAPDNLSAINGSFSMAKCGSSKCFLTDAFSLVLYVILVFREIRDVITAPLSNNRCVPHFLLFMCFQKCEKRYCRPRFFFFFT